MLSNTYTWISSGISSVVGLTSQEQQAPQDVITVAANNTSVEHQEKVEWSKWLNDPQIFAVNRNRPHVPLRSFPTVQTASRALLGNMGIYGGGLTRLSSEWRVKEFASVKDLPKQYASTTFSDAGWDKVLIPHKRDSNINKQDSPICVYRYWFYASQDQLNKPCYLCFDGVGGALMVWVNQQFLGYSEEGNLPQDFTVNGCLKEGYNLLVAVVTQKSTGSMIEAKRPSRPFGLYGDVALLFKPQVHISNFSVQPKLILGKGMTAELEAEVDIVSTAKELLKDVSVELHLLDQDNAYVSKVEVTSVQFTSTTGTQASTNIGSPSTSKQAQDKKPQGDGITTKDYIWVPNVDSCQATASFKVDVSGQGIKLWTAEEPNLYAAVLVLKDGDGEVIECEGCQVGFRTVDIIKRGLCVNGVPVLIKGIEYDPDLTADEENLVRELQLLKRHNFNAVMTSLCKIRWLELCNQMGLYVVDVADLQCSGEECNNMNDTEWVHPFMSRGIRMFHAHRNNPSIILWSLGYESGFSAAHSALAGYLSHIDPQRHIFYPGAGGATSSTDIVCPQLLNQEQLLEVLHNPSENRPIIISKFFQPSGNTCGGLKDMWDVISQFPAVQGGFVSLDSLKLSDGVVHPALVEAKAIYKPLDFAWAISTLQAFEKDAKTAKFNYNFQVAVRNNLQSAPNGNFRVLWRIAINGHIADFDGKYDLSKGMEGWGETSEIPSQILPGQFEQVSLPVKPIELLQEISKYGWRSIEVVLELRAEVIEGNEVYPSGHFLCEHQMVVPHTYLDCAARYVMALAAFQDDLEDPRTFYTSKVSCAPLSVEEVEDSWMIKGQGLEVKISKFTGGIVNLNYGELHGGVLGLQPSFVRMPTTSDLNEINGNSYAKIWKEAGLDWLSIADEINMKLITADNSHVTFEVNYTLVNMQSVPLSFPEREIHDNNTQAEKHNHSQQETSEEANGQLVTVEKQQPANGVIVTAPPKAKIGVKIVYHVLHSGIVLMDCSFDTRQAINFDVEPPFLKTLPKVGLEVKLSEDMDQLQYYGRGPHENYIDRKAGALLRRYNQSVPEMQVNYPHTQESGGRCDVRCVLLTNDNGQGIGIFDADAFGARTFQMSVSNRGTLTLDGETNESSIDECIHLYMDHKHMGIGGSAHAMGKYCIPPDVYNFTVGLVPYIGLSTPDKAMEMLIGTWRQNMLRK